MAHLMQMLRSWQGGLVILTWKGTDGTKGTDETGDYSEAIAEVK